MKTPEELYKDALKHGRFPEGSEEECIIATDSMRSYLYATDIIKGRFELGEPAIASCYYSSCHYASRVLGERFKLGEDVIMVSEYAGEYLHIHRSEFTDEDRAMIKMKYPTL